MIQPFDPGPAEQEWTIPDYLVELLDEHTATGIELLDIFTADTSKQISRLHEAASKSDLRDAKNLLHGLTGSCGQMGANRIADRCARLEADLDDLTAPEMLLRVGELRQCCEILFRRMNARSNSGR